MVRPFEVVEQQAERQALLDRLYEADGRAAADHPMHGLYTGLMVEHNERQAQE